MNDYEGHLRNMRHLSIINNIDVCQKHGESVSATMTQRQMFRKSTRFALVADLESSGCRNAGIAAQYHDYCALAVDIQDVRGFMVGLLPEKVGERR